VLEHDLIHLTVSLMVGGPDGRAGGEGRRLPEIRVNVADVAKEVGPGCESGAMRLARSTCTEGAPVRLPGLLASGRHCGDVHAQSRGHRREGSSLAATEDDAAGQAGEIDGLEGADADERGDDW
jgi:hypothetical protein